MISNIMKILIRKRFKKLYLFCIFLLILLYTEFFLYHVNRNNWHRIMCNNRELCTKIILIADPQIIGKQNEIIHFLTPLSIWDSDRYLRITYQQVFNFVEPDVVIFLGDLFDEGSISSELEFKEYVNRLYDIFHIKQNYAIQYIWLPGDNDIGGEGIDVVTSEKLKKFNQAFSQPDIIQYKNITFFKINKLLQYIPKITDNKRFFDTNIIKVGLSHIPILTSRSTFTNEVSEKLKPHVLFTAHEHSSKIIVSEIKNKDSKQIITNPKLSKSFQYKLGIDFVYEFLVPTCSYRMGTTYIGYGFAIIENNNFQYTVLWSPIRFPTLVFYFCLIIVLTLMLFIKLCIKLMRRKTTNAQY